MGLAHRVLRGSGRSVVLAVNYPPPDMVGLDVFLSRVRDLVSGVKIGLPYILRYGLKGLASLINKYESDYYFIADLKLADLDEVMGSAASEVSSAGFHGVVAHAFVGYRGALESLSTQVRDLGMDLFLQVSLPHEGASDVLDPSYPLVRNVLNLVDASGLVVPASKSIVIKDLRSLFSRKYIILASGILKMGAQSGEGLCSGADAEVVGRAITLALNPEEATKEIVNLQKRYLESRRDACVSK